MTDLERDIKELYAAFPIWEPEVWPAIQSKNKIDIELQLKSFFENKDVATYLNKHFISIKIDREERPDLDHYFMQYLLRVQGHGGWPLTVILTPDLKPLFAATYLPVTARYGLPSFLEVLSHILELYKKNTAPFPAFTIPEQQDATPGEIDFVKTLESNYDSSFGGFGFDQKFPPHTTLLFMLFFYSSTKDPLIKNMTEKTLNAMAQRGLHDHLQGGFFRYTVDREWTIPHFEKMLYDQAMLLWVYSLAYHAFGNVAYKKTAEKILTCLAETFEHQGR